MPSNAVEQFWFVVILFVLESVVEIQVVDKLMKPEFVTILTKIILCCSLIAILVNFYFWYVMQLHQTDNGIFSLYLVLGDMFCSNSSLGELL